MLKKSYQKSKYYKAEFAKNRHIKSVINKQMKSFSSNKESEKVRSQVDKIMVDWTHKRKISPILPSLWACQYALLKYINSTAFLEVINNIGLSKLFLVVSELSDGKAVSLFSIPNEFWKQCGNDILACLLVLLNSCLKAGNVPVSMIPKPYNWDEILTNTKLIVLIKTVRKILSKILSDHILFACSKFGILHGNNFSVLKSTSTQSPIFAVGLVVENVLEKDHEIWLVLQDMQKAYNSVSWYHLKICLECIKICSRFIKFFGEIHMNRVKRQEQLCDYKINSNFVAKLGRVESNGGKFSFFTASAFVDDMIWVKNSQTLTQYILNIVNEFFKLNDISINNDKTMAIPINSRMANASLFISGKPISIVQKGEFHRYLGVFLFTEDLLKPSLFKAHVNVRFFSNMVFKKVISDKQFSYMVLAWDVLVRKDLRSKALLLKNFLNKALYYPFLYSLKSFEQMQAESKIASVVGFSNASGILGYLFLHHALDLQILEWMPLYPLCHLVKLRVCPLNNFLAGVVKIFINANVFLFNHISCVFCGSNCFSISKILGTVDYFGVVHFLKHFGIAFGDILVTKAFVHMNDFLTKFRVCEAAKELNIYINDLLSGLSTEDITCGAVAFFSKIGLDVSVRVQGLLLSTLAELQTIVLVLECILSSCSMVLYLDSQVALDACIQKNISVKWVKVKGHSDIVDNNHADTFAYVMMCLVQPHPENVNSQQTGINNIEEKRPKTSVVTTPDATTLEYYQSIYTHCKQRFNIPDGIEVVKKSVYQYIENCINNYLFGNYNISEVRSNFYNNLVHYSQLGTEDLNSETLATYFQELNFNIIKYCKETYPVQSQYSIDFESETETSNKGKQKLKQYSKTTPNTPILPKTTAKHLQTSEQGTSSKLPLTITPFPASLTQAQTPNLPLNRFARLKNFTSPRSPIRQQEPLQTSSNLLDFLAENQNEHSEIAVNKKNNSEKSEEESIDSENEEDEITAYIAKIPEFYGEDIETRIADKWFENLTTPFNNWTAFKTAFLEQFIDNNTSITL
ncbi:hypothetical protein G9A89_002045 [Geosiphon pyriformis]|nr:hypothetical protein G9A89_002045 [Geosiphon pyriformis]